MLQRYKITSYSFLELSLLSVLAYFCFEYKSFEHKAIHGLSKVFLSKPYPTLSFDLLIFLSDVIILGCSLYCLKFLKISLFKQEKKWLFIVVFLACLSVLLTPYNRELHGYARLIQLSFCFFCFYTFSSVLTKKNPKNLLKMALSIILVIGIIEAFIGLSHYLLQESIGLKKFGEPRLISNTDTISSIPTSNGKVWIFNLFQTNASILFRSHGTFPHPNIFGCFLVTSLLASLYWFFFTKRYLKVMMSIGIFLQILCLIVTFSRSALLGLLIGSALLLLLFKFLFQRKILFPSCLIIGSLIIGGMIFSPQIYNRGGVVNQNTLSKGSNDSRMYYNKIALKMMFTHPILGVGYDFFISNMNKFVSKEEYNPSFGSTVHNIYLLLGSQTGIFSLVSFVIFLGMILKKGIKYLSMESACIFSIFLCYIIIGFFDCFFLLFQQGKILFFSMAGMLSGYSTYFSNTKEAQSEGCNSILYSKLDTEKC